MPVDAHQIHYTYDHILMLMHKLHNLRLEPSTASHSPPTISAARYPSTDRPRAGRASVSRASSVDDSQARKMKGMQGHIPHYPLGTDHGYTDIPKSNLNIVSKYKYVCK